MITYKQLTLAEIFEDCQNKFDNDKYRFVYIANLSKPIFLFLFYLCIHFIDRFNITIIGWMIVHILSIKIQIFLIQISLSNSHPMIHLESSENTSLSPHK